MNFTEADELAKTYSARYIETSAKTEQGIRELMEDIFEQILEEKLRQMAQEEPTPEECKSNPESFKLRSTRHSITESMPTKNEKRKCC